MASLVYDYGKLGLLNGTIDWINTVIKARIVEGTYTAASTHQYMSSIGTGVGTDPTIADKTAEVDLTNDFAWLESAANPTWNMVAAGSTAAGVVVYAFGTTDADSVPIVYYDTADVPTNGGSIALTWATSSGGGVLRTS